MNTGNAAAVVCGAIEGTALSAEESAFFKRCAPAGVTIFRRNIPEQHSRVTELIDDLYSQVGAKLPLICAVDQEGGRVARFRGDSFPEFGPALKLAGGRKDAGALAEIREAGHAVGKALLAKYLNVNFAPVLDVWTEPTNEAIGDRAFGVEVDAVKLRAEAYLDGLQASGVKGCLKHFPGQGHANFDTHEASAVVDVKRTAIFDREIVPFRELCAKAPMVMVAHCIYPALAPVEASRSSVIIEDILRKELGFQGVVVSDDMNMKAIPQDLTDWQEALVESVVAGVDLLLVCRHVERMEAAVEILSERERTSPAFASRLAQAAARVTKMRSSLAPRL